MMDSSPTHNPNNIVTCSHTESLYYVKLAFLQASEKSRDTPVKRCGSLNTDKLLFRLSPPRTPPTQPRCALPSSSTSCASVVTSTVAIDVSCTNDDDGRHQRSVVVVSALGVSLVDRRLSLSSSVAGRILATHNSNAVDTYH